MLTESLMPIESLMLKIQKIDQYYGESHTLWNLELDVPQGRQIFPLLTVEENLRTGLAVRKDGSKKIPERVYELFPVLKEMRHRRGGDLSGGQQQQLAIGRALVIEPHLLILDEPGEGIQPNIVAQIGEVIRRLIKEDGLTVLLVEQKLPFARKYADRFAILDRGPVSGF